KDVSPTPHDATRPRRESQNTHEAAGNSKASAVLSGPTTLTYLIPMIEPEREIRSDDEGGENEPQQIGDVHSESPFDKPNSIIGAEPKQGKMGKKIKFALKRDVARAEVIWQFRKPRVECEIIPGLAGEGKKDRGQEEVPDKHAHAHSHEYFGSSADGSH